MVGYPKTITGIATTGVVKDSNGNASFALPEPYGRTFALCVSIPSGAITSWSVNLEGSLDNVNWTSIITHSSTIGSTAWSADKPVNFIRINVTALSLNTAPSISASVLAVP